MACAIYPQTPEFLDVMRQEATSVVRRLRDHPSLALWSGDNEVDESYLSSGLDPAHNKITREVLPQVVFQCDPYRPYLPSSPYMSPEVIATGLGGSCQKSICGARETTSEALLSIIDCTGLELTWLCKGNYSATPTFKLR